MLLYLNTLKWWRKKHEDACSKGFRPNKLYFTPHHINTNTQGAVSFDTAPKCTIFHHVAVYKPTQ